MRGKIPAGTLISCAGDDSAFEVLSDLGKHGIAMVNASGEVFVAPVGSVRVEKKYSYVVSGVPPAEE